MERITKYINPTTSKWLFFLTCVLPIFKTVGEQTWWLGFMTIGFGWMALFYDWIQVIFWLANVAYYLAYRQVSKKNNKPTSLFLAVLLSIAAIALAIAWPHTHPFVGMMENAYQINTLHVGYYTWIASFVVMLLYSAIALQKAKKAQRE